jgi:central kinetochore subunit Mis15/CHL4
VLFKTLSALSRKALLDLATQWCLPEHRQSCAPYVNEDFEPDDDTCPWAAATSFDELIDLYRDELSARKGSKRELLDRILEGDWRHGISLQQLAMAETRSILDNAGTRRWTAFEIYNKSAPKPSKASKAASSSRTSPKHHPKLNPASFVLSLHRQLSSITKAHYYISHPKSLPLTVIRISLFDTPYKSPNFAKTPSLLDASKSIILAFPTGAPSFVYIARPSVSSSFSRELLDPESSSLLAFVTKSIGPALSRVGQHFALRPTALTARSLDTLLAIRGPGRGNASGGGWSIFADEKRGTETGDALNLYAATNPMKSVDRIVAEAATKASETGVSDASNDGPDKENMNASRKQPSSLSSTKRPFQHAEPAAHLPPAKRTRLKREAAGRFGVSALPETDGNAAISRFDVNIKDAFPMLPAFKGIGATAIGVDEQHQLAGVRMGFQGRDVFAGIRQLTELGVVDAKRLPAWMTGEGNVSVGVVKDGRLMAWDGL